MGRNKFIYKAVVIAVGCLFCSFAHASVIVTFSEDISPDQIQYYWNGEQQAANNDGTRTVSPTPVDVDAVDPAKQASPFAASPPTNRYVFASSNAAALTNSQKIWIRVWRGTKNSLNGTYTALNNGTTLGTSQPIDSPATSPANDTFTLDYPYIYAYPATATITSYVESGTTTQPLPSGLATTSKTITFASSSDQVNGKTVEIGSSHWQVTQGGTPHDIAVGGTSLTLDTDHPPAGITLRSGDSVTLKVKHINLWNQEAAAWSGEETYTVGATGGEVKKTWSFVKGINTFSIPFGGLSNIKGYLNNQESAVDVSTVEKLIMEINRQAGSNIVSVFGWYDSSVPTHKGMISIAAGDYKGDGTIDRTTAQVTGGTVPGILDQVIAPNQPYQVTITSSKDFALKGVK